MDYSTSIKRAYSHRFFLDEGHLRQIVSILADFGKKKDYDCEIVFVLNLSDATELEVKSVDQVLTSTNVVGKELIRLQAFLKNASKSYYDPLCKLEFNKRTYYNPSIEYSIKDSDKDWAFLLAEELKAHVGRSSLAETPWVRRLSKLGGIADIVLFLVVIFVLGFIANRIYPFLHIRLGDLTLLHIFLGVPAIVVLGFICYGLIDFLDVLGRIAKLISIKSVFYWGDEVDLYESRRGYQTNLRWVVLIGFLVSLTAGIVTALILNGILK